MYTVQYVGKKGLACAREVFYCVWEFVRLGRDLEVKKVFSHKRKRRGGQFFLL